MKHPLFYFILGGLLVGPLSIYFTARSTQCPECPEEIKTYSIDGIDRYFLHSLETVGEDSTETLKGNFNVLLCEEYVSIAGVEHTGSWDSTYTVFSNSACRIELNHETGAIFYMSLGEDSNGYWCSYKN